MSNLQSLIDTLGPPPPEICLDWALQLASLDNDSEAHGNAQNATSGGSEARAIAWLDVTVEADGKLALPLEVDTSVATLEPLIERLLEWSGRPPNSAASTSADVDDPAGASSVNATPLKQRLQLRALQLSTQTALADPLSGKAAEDPPPNLAERARTARAAIAKRQPKQAKPRQAKSRRMLMIVVGTVSLIVIVSLRAVLNGPSSPDAGDRIAQTGSRSSPERVSETVAGAFESVKTVDEQPIAPLSLANSSDLLAQPSLSNRPKVDDRLESAAEFSLATDVDLTISRDPSSTRGVTANSADAKAEVEVLSISSAELLETSNIGASNIAEGNSVDVLAEFTEMNASAERQPSETVIETDLSTHDATPSSGAHPPLAIATFPVLQLQRLDTAVRVRRPVWQLRLETSEGFEATPAEPQSIASRETAAWAIRETQGAKPMTQVLVQVQLSGNRNPTLRWRVVASAADLPTVAIPLDKKSLEGLQRVFTQRRQLLQLEVERLRQLTSVDGLPGELRSAMSANRRMHEEQSAMAGRLLEIVAAAQQIEGWLDGQIAVHAELRDAASADSTPLLQFGEIRPPAPNACTE